MSNSSLISYTKISPNKYSPRNHVIDTITIHCMAGNLSVERCGDIFASTSRGASSNYGIGSDGRIAMYVEEKNGSWCSSNKANDMRAITIEVANDGGEPDWHVSDKAMQSLIKLCADICSRNNIKKLVWSTNKSDRINHSNGCNMTVHRDFAAKACPGDYLYGKHSYIASEVNKILEAKAAANQKGDFAGMTQAEKESFVRNVLYIGLLDRQADEAGLKYWTTKLTDTAKLTDIVNSVMKSEEFKNRTITVAYQRLLKRDPDAAGLKYYKENYLNKGKTMDDVYNSIKKSAEYKKLHK